MQYASPFSCLTAYPGAYGAPSFPVPETFGTLNFASSQRLTDRPRTPRCVLEGLGVFQSVSQGTIHADVREPDDPD